ncbi:serine hydrolase FSH [Powellomyces hirtus]|nr:serine hydrolase FSH [Powellomyces hirtus]
MSAGTPSAAPRATAQRLRILCLHGYTQNANVFRSRLAVMRKDLKNIADFEFVSAPHVVPKEEIPPVASAASVDLNAPVDEMGPRTWWRPFTLPSKLEDSIAELTEIWSKASPPFDGILGFSQGATMAALVLPSLDPPPRFSIHCSGFFPHDPAHGAMLAALPTVPSLHVMGRSDAWVPPARSEALRAMFKDPQTMVHDGGHFIPTNATHRRTYKEFVGQFTNSAPLDSGEAETQ